MRGSYDDEPALFFNGDGYMTLPYLDRLASGNFMSYLGSTKWS